MVASDKVFWHLAVLVATIFSSAQMPDLFVVCRCLAG